MKRFTRIYSGELFKIFTKKTIIGLIIGIIVILAFSIFTVEMINTVSETLDSLDGNKIGSNQSEDAPLVLSGEALDQAIAQTKQQIEELKLEIKTDRNLPLKERQRFSTQPGELYGLNATLKVLTYCKENNIPFDFQKNSLSYNTASFALSLAIAFLSIIAVIFAITAAARSIADEWKRGTLKMTLIRPIKREELLGAKLLASFTSGAMIFVFQLIIISIYVLIKFGTAAPDMLFVFNAKNVFEASSALYVVLQVIDVFITIALYVAMTAFISVLLKNTVASVILPLLSYLGAVSSILTLAGVGAYSLSKNLNTLSVYFTMNNAPLHGMNFWWSAVAVALYAAIFITISFIAFKKRDIA